MTILPSTTCRTPPDLQSPLPSSLHIKLNRRFVAFVSESASALILTTAARYIPFSLYIRTLGFGLQTVGMTPSAIPAVSETVGASDVDGSDVTGCQLLAAAVTTRTDSQVLLIDGSRN